MPSSKTLAQALDRCLDRIQSGSATMEDCLRDYPELAEQLGPLMRTALQAESLLTPAGPTAAYRAASEARLLNRLRHAQAVQRPAPQQPRARPRRWRLAYAMAGLVLAVALVGSSVGVASAAAGSLPGDPLYGVKRGLEEASLALSVTSAGDTALLMEFAQRRLAEAQALIEAGRAQDVPGALAGYERDLDRLLAQEHQADESLAKLEAALQRHEQVLSGVLERAAPQAREAIERALDHSMQGRLRVKQQRQDQRPENVPPGQLKRTPSAEAQQGGQRPDDEKTRSPAPPARATKTPKDK